jgi:hypothetical protein
VSFQDLATDDVANAAGGIKPSDEAIAWMGLGAGSASATLRNGGAR